MNSFDLKPSKLKPLLAIESIDDKVKSYLTPKIEMNKKITILPE